MSNVRGVRDVCEGNEILFDEANDLRCKNQQLYRLILQLVLDLDELEDTLSAARAAPEPAKAR
jgi:hypothetical protein